MGKHLRKIIVMAAMVLSTVVWGVEESQADAITLYNTGVDGSGAFLNGGTIDPHYTLISSADSFYTGPNVYVSYDVGYPLNVGLWMENGPNSKWINPAPDQGRGVLTGYYYYRTTFDLTDLDPYSASINGVWSTDNIGVDIFINALSTGNTIPYGSSGDFSFQSFHPFSITSGFVNGINTLDFVVWQEGSTGPSGLRVELSGTAAPVPEPSTMLLLGSGLVGLWGYGRRRLKG